MFTYTIDDRVAKPVEYFSQMARLTSSCTTSVRKRIDDRDRKLRVGDCRSHVQESSILALGELVSACAAIVGREHLHEMLAFESLGENNLRFRNGAFSDDI